ncbi:MAG: copper amine oxidase N-terminal domain-containing protein [Armatimonadota bacterium]
MKRYILSLALLLAGGTLAFASPEVLIVSGRAFMPVRYCSESYGARVVYTQPTKQIELSIDGNSVRLVIGERRAWYGQEVVMLDTAPFIYRQVTYVPVLVVGRVLKADVGWDQKTRRVTIIRAGKTLVMVGRPWTPPGLAKKGGLPPGQAKKIVSGHGNAGQSGHKSNAQGHGKGKGHK